MKKFTYFLIAAICLMVSGCKENKGQDMALKLYAEIDNSKSNALSDNEKQEGWLLLFDGYTGNGWHGYNQVGIPECWAIEDGSFTMNSVGGGEEQDIITDKTYRSFAFTVEYKLTKGANSGIVFQAKEDPKYKYSYETGPEFQLIDQDNWPDPLEDWQIHGANYAMYPPLAKPYNPIGEWNRLLLLVNGNDVTQVINNVVVVKYTKYSDEWNKLRNSGKWIDFPDWGKFDEGHITLQNHGTKLWYKNIKIKEIK
jgi:Domain of Unknown Function (DUF1080).